MNYFGSDGQVNSPTDYFAQNNYVICRGALEPERLNSFVDYYERNVVTASRLFFRQSTQWERNELTKAGGLRNTLLNPHCYERKADRKLSDLILEILSESLLHQALRDVAKHESYRLYQTMLFDHTTTRPHQDWIYLDSRPNGHVVAAWLALEDIPETGIRFYVYPGTQDFKPEAGYKAERGMKTYDYFLHEVDRFLNSWSEPMFAPALKKGDIFFWGSRIIHGSVAGTNPDQRRRSIAAHFLPAGFGAGNLKEDFNNFEMRKYGSMEYCHWKLTEPGLVSRLGHYLKSIRTTQAEN